MYYKDRDYDYDREYRESDLREDGWERVSDGWYTKDGSLSDALLMVMA